VRPLAAEVAEQAAEKGLISSEKPEKHPSGAKALVDSAWFIDPALLNCNGAEQKSNCRSFDFAALRSG